MTLRNTVLRLCAIVFAVMISVADGNASMLQAIANDWAADAIYLVGFAVAFTNGGPTFIAAAWEWNHRILAGVLVIGFLISGVISCALTLQRIVAQIDRQQHRTDKANHPIVLAERKLRQARTDAARLRHVPRTPPELVAKTSQRRLAEAAMDAALNDPRAPGKGPAYRRARDERDRLAAEIVAETADHRAAIANSAEDHAKAVARVAELERSLETLGPPKGPSKVDAGTILALAAALLAPVVSIGLFLFASAVPRHGRDVTEHHRASVNASERQSAVDQHQLTSRSTDNLTSVPAEPPENRQPDLMLGDVHPTKLTSPPPPSGPKVADQATRGDVVRDILKETFRRAHEEGRAVDWDRHAPGWKECSDRYGRASATITSYRKAALKIFKQEMRRREAAA